VTAVELSGRDLATEIRAQAAEDAARLTATGVTPALTVVTANDDAGSAWYVSSIAKAAAKAGIGCGVRDLGPGADGTRIGGELDDLAADHAVHGVILQAPLPAGVRTAELAERIAPRQDVDGANPVSLGRLVAGLPAFPPATAEAVVALLRHYAIPMRGVHVAVVGRSVVVGKPLAHLLLAEDATVTICHSRTADLAAVTRQAGIVVAAAGRAWLITSEHIRPGATVIDVGTNEGPDGTLVGDVDAATVREVASGLSPVPGGVGPVTTALLLAHVVRAASG
jgi:methylenetetrahydrofolate dehydrogenase (NADP+)/methenyltetrahydrofolate cyclohydrolase